MVEDRDKSEFQELKLTVTASSRDGVESNGKQVRSPYDKKLDSALCTGEPARDWRSQEEERGKKKKERKKRPVDLWERIKI